MTVAYLRDQRHAGTVAEIARVKFPFPNDEHPDLEATVNVPKPKVAVGTADGKDLYPDIVVVRRPGLWLKMMAVVETADTVTDERAIDAWLPYSKCGDLFLYVPFGSVQKAKQLCRQHGVAVKGIRTWRFRPVWGLDVTEA